jgi:uncharacterized protein (DUF1330 family)
MRRFLAPCLALLAGVAFGAFGLHAQTKPKAYTVTENELLDAGATVEYRALILPAIQAAGGRTLNTAEGKIVALMGAASPQRVALTEWDSAEQAQAFYTSKTWSDLAPQRDKAQRVVRVYSVEVVN